MQADPKFKPSLDNSDSMRVCLKIKEQKREAHYGLWLGPFMGSWGVFKMGNGSYVFLVSVGFPECWALLERQCWHMWEGGSEIRS